MSSTPPQQDNNSTPISLPLHLLRPPAINKDDSTPASPIDDESNSPNSSPRSWTTEDDNNLRKCVDEHGDKDFMKVSQVMSSAAGRLFTDVQCSKRWVRLSHQKLNIKVCTKFLNSFSSFKNSSIYNNAEGTMDKRRRREIEITCTCSLLFLKY